MLITTTDYKAALFNYQVVKHASMTMVGRLTRSRRIYDLGEKNTTMESSNQGKKDEKEDEKLTLQKLIKASKYKVVKQLAKTPTQILLMSLLTSSDVYYEALFKVLKEVKGPQSVSESALGHIVDSVFAMDQITFLSKEVDEEGGHHTKALFIVVMYNDKIVLQVLTTGHPLMYAHWPP